MGIAASTIDVTPPSGFTATNLQDLLYEMAGSLSYATSAAGSADAKADNIQSQLNTVAGTVNGYISPKVGKVDAEMGQVFTALGLTRAS